MNIPQLTEFQVDILTRIANSPSTDIYAAVTGVDSDKAKDDIDSHFREALALIDIDLVADVSAYPKYKNVIDGMLAEQGRTLRILQISPQADILFRKGEWQKIIN